MFCPFCGNNPGQVTRFCLSCGGSLECLKGTRQTGLPSAQGTSKQPEHAKQTEQPGPSYRHFMEYRNSKSKEKQSFNCGKGRLKQERRQVQINIGMMSPQGVDLKPRRGKTLPLFTDPEIAAPVLLERAVQKAFNKDMDEGPYVLLYPDCSEVVNVPGSEKPFTLAEYKKDLGKAYARITLFICLEKQEGTIPQTLIRILSSHLGAQLNSIRLTLVFQPRNKSTPKHRPENEGKARGHSSTTQHGQIVISDTEDMGPPKTHTDKTTCYSTYTDLYVSRKRTRSWLQST